jgi:hypothetical protein
MGVVGCSPYLVLALTENPSTVPAPGTSTVMAYFPSYDGYPYTTVPDGTPVTFTATAGTVSPSYSATYGGMAYTKFTPSGSGIPAVTATVDYQSVSIPITPAGSAIVIDPVSASTVYAGIDGHGIYKSTDSGASWQPATIQPVNQNIRALVINPAKHTNLFAGTYGGGVYKSVDSGDTWTRCRNIGLANLNVLSLVSDSTGKLYAGTEAGVFTSPDCNTWTAQNSGLP